VRTDTVLCRWIKALPSTKSLDGASQKAFLCAPAKQRTKSRVWLYRAKRLHVPALIATRLLKALAPAVLLQVMALPSLAQTQIQQKPATPEELYTYGFMGGISTCAALKAKIANFDQSFGNAITMVVSTIVVKHKSQVVDPQGKTLTLTAQQLESPVVLAVFGQVDRLCRKEITGQNQEQFDKLKSTIEAGLKRLDSENKKNQ